MVYGTKELPDAKNRAVASAPSPPTTTSPPAQTSTETTVAATVTQQQPQPKMMMEPLEQTPSFVARPADWLDGGGVDRKSSLHQNNVDQNRGASNFLPSSAASDPVLPVVSSSSSSSNGGVSAHCPPSHWDSAASICLSTCLLLASHHLILSRWTQT